MTNKAAGSELRYLLTGVVKQFLIWVPIVIGLTHQFLMFFFGIDGIYVVLEPPGTIFPFVTLEMGWWLLLTIGTSTLCALAYFDRIRPHRLVYPFYIYLLFLLIYVKPIITVQRPVP